MKALLLVLVACVGALGVAGCDRSHVTDTPVASPPPPTVRPDVTGVASTVRIARGADAAHLHLVLVREGTDPREAEVAAHPSREELMALLAGVTHDARVVVVPEPELPSQDAIAVLDALREAGYTRFAISR